MGSYEKHGRVVGGILEAAGIDGFLANCAELRRRADIEGEELRAFVDVWLERQLQHIQSGAYAGVAARELARAVLDNNLLMMSLGPGQYENVEVPETRSVALSVARGEPPGTARGPLARPS